MRSYTTLSSSVTGYQKSLEGRPCEDAVKVIRVGGATLMAVADGHGDRRCLFAHIGASLAVRAACEVLKRFYKMCDCRSPAVYWNTYRTEIARALVKTFLTSVVRDYAVRASAQLTEEERDALLGLIGDAYCVPVGAYTPEQIRMRYQKRKALEDRLSQISYLYGTTVRAAVLTSDYMFNLALGDGDTVAVIEDHVEWLLPASVAYECETASLCEDINTLPEEFLFSYVELGNGTAGGVADLRRNVKMVVLSTDGLRNAFTSEFSYMEKIKHIAMAMCERNRRNTSRAVKCLFEKLTMESVFRDDITAVFAVAESDA